MASGATCPTVVDVDRRRSGARLSRTRTLEVHRPARPGRTGPCRVAPRPVAIRASL